ncbi:MAG: translesion error-prone DNA polymerase V autoproteolytic subunit [Candidatus Dojkabacteria bacterium]
MQIKSIHPVKKSKETLLPFYLESIKAGFPSPADDFIDKKLDLNEYLVKHPVATFFVRVSGDSMINAGIHTGDILVVDKALDAKDKNIVVAVINGELTVKRLRMKDGKVALMPENSNYKPIIITSEDNFSIWGVVTNVIHNLI